MSARLLGRVGHEVHTPTIRPQAAWNSSVDLKFLPVEAGTSLSANSLRRYLCDDANGRSAPLPTVSFSTAEQWAWPAPPLAWKHLPLPADNVAQPCVIEVVCGKTVHGEMRNFDPVAGTVTFASTADGDSVSMAYSSFRRLTLTTPLRAISQSPSGRVQRLPAAAQERDYTLHGAAQAPSVSGRTIGYVEASAGLYLFTPVEEEAAVQRVFVPRWAYSRCELGQSAEEIAASLWISSPQVLLEAIERQERMPVLPIGQSILALGLLTRAQLERELARSVGDSPLGESLVAAGLISHADLQTVIAHKMGYPMVDLNRFPVDPLAVTKVPKDIAARHRMLPLMIDQGRLIVAVDRPSRVTELRSIHTYLRTSIVPVLASALQITVALDRLLRDVWSQHVVGRPAFVQSTH